MKVSYCEQLTWKGGSVKSMPVGMFMPSFSARTLRAGADYIFVAWEWMNGWMHEWLQTAWARAWGDVLVWVSPLRWARRLSPLGAGLQLTSWVPHLALGSGQWLSPLSGPTSQLNLNTGLTIIFTVLLSFALFHHILCPLYFWNKGVSFFCYHGALVLENYVTLNFLLKASFLLFSNF